MLADYVDGSMDPRLREELDAHLAKCEPCMAFTKTFRATCEETRKLRERIEYSIPPEVRKRLETFVRTAALKYPEKVREYRDQVERDRREKIADSSGRRPPGSSPRPRRSSWRATAPPAPSAGSISTRCGKPAPPGGPAILPRASGPT